MGKIFRLSAMSEGLALRRIDAGLKGILIGQFDGGRQHLGERHGSILAVWLADHSVLSDGCEGYIRRIFHTC